MKQKKLLLLGGLRYLLPVIEAAHKLGHYVITCDYVPDNIAHRYSDEYHNVSIIDREAVLELCRGLAIDGIMSFAVDPGVVTAAYVAEKMGLPAAGPYESVRILQDKGLFRKFLTDNGFTVPTAKSYTDPEEALNDTARFRFPVIVKPTDSAGSKGVTRIERREELADAIRYAMDHSLSKSFLIEDFIEKRGFSSDTDSFVVDGKIEFISFSNQRFDTKASNPYTPAAYSWPSSIGADHQKELHGELQRLMTLLGMKTSVYNIEVREGLDGKAYIMEVSPRGGGNRLSEVLRYATGVDLISNAVRAAVGDRVVGIEQKPYNGCWAEIILHSDREGFFKSMRIDPALEKNIVETDLWVREGDHVCAFNGANDAIGTLIMRFGTQEELATRLDSQRDWLHITVE